MVIVIGNSNRRIGVLVVVNINRGVAGTGGRK
jgi:hypothetical protein